MITAKVTRDDDGLNKDEVYEIEYISMGQSYTSIYLKAPCVALLIADDGYSTGMCKKECTKTDLEIVW
jgi:hypothetical protein